MTQYQMGWTGTAQQWQCGGTAGVKQRALTFNDRERRVGGIQNHLFHRTACIIYAYGIKGYTSATDCDADLPSRQKLSLYALRSGGLPDF
jgi:hypothetical protein